MAYPNENELPEVFDLIHLRDVCRAFIDEHEIDCPEMAFITAYSSGETYDFIKTICNLIGYYGQER